jgi:Tol biopolymer transport system component
MTPKTVLIILLIFVLIVINCDRNYSLVSFDKIKYPKQLTSTGKDITSYWSPNGEYIAFLSFRNTFNPNMADVLLELWLMKSDGSNQHPIISIHDLYDGRTTVSNVCWSKKSNDMLVQIYTPMGSEIWKVTVDGTKTRLSSVNDWAERPQYSPDGSKIAYMIQGPNPPQGSPVYRLYVANANFLESVLIETGLIEGFAWEGNSNELIYTLYNRTQKNYDLWKTSISGKEKVQFSHTLVSEEEISCSTDGKYIAYSAQNIVYVSPSDTFQTNKILNNAHMPEWIPNSNLLLLLIANDQISHDKNYQTEWLIVDLEGTIIKRFENGKPNSFNFSSNGEYFVYSLDGNLWVDQLIE